VSNQFFGNGEALFASPFLFSESPAGGRAKS